MSARAVRYALVAVVVATACACARRPAAPPRWNAVLISVDTLRADRLNCYGYQRRRVTPHIDALARDGVLFQNHIASSPWTTPSHMSLLTSLVPSAHGFDHVLRDPDEPPRTGHLATSGWATAAFTGGLTLDPRFGFDQGFARYETSSRKLRRRNVQPLYDWIDESQERPFFLFWHTFEVHAPYLETAFVDEVLPPALALKLKRGIARAAPVWIEESRSPSEQAALLDRLHAYTLPVCDALYDGGVESMDRWVGDLVGRLRQRGLYDRTLIALTSDHGEQLGERGVDPDARGRGIFNLHGHTLYEELLQVPLVVKLPQQEHAGTRVRAVTRGIDVMPTVLDVLRLPPPDHMQGTSLRGLWEGRPEPPRLAVSESLSTPNEKKAVRSDRYKYILSTTAEEAGRYGRSFIPERSRGPELYDLALDPAEKVNLMVNPTDSAGRTAAALERVLRRALAVRGTSDKRTLPATTLEELKALGYVQ